MNFCNSYVFCINSTSGTIIRRKLLSKGIFCHTLRHNKAYEKQYLTLTWFLSSSVSIWLNMATKNFSPTRSVFLSSLKAVGHCGQRFKMFGCTNLVSIYKSERGANYCIKSHLERTWLNGKSKPNSAKKMLRYSVFPLSWMIKFRAYTIVSGCSHTIITFVVTFSWLRVMRD